MLPKIIHHIVGPKQNELVARCLNSWQKLKKHGFEVRLWNDDDIITFFTEHYRFALGAVLHARNHAEVADIARYAIVHKYGGHYIDWDIELLLPNKFLRLCNDNPNGYLVQDPKNQTLASEAFAALAGEQYLFDLMDNINDIYLNDFRDTLPTPQYSGPYRMREVYYFTKQRSLQTAIPIKEVFLYDYTEIREMPEREIDAPMIHYWMHSWIKR